MAFTRLSTSVKRDRVAEAIRRAILSGELQPGERIIELRLARQLGVSQTPVREAIASLAREGLVIKLDHRGTFVTSLDEQELREVITLRSVLEGYCARLATKRLSADDLRLFESLVEKMREAARGRDLAALTEADLRFHQSLYELSGHRLLGEVLSGLQQRMRLALAFADAAYSSDLVDVAESHVPLISALAREDPELAERAARAHVLDVHGLVIADAPSSPGSSPELSPTHSSPKQRGRARRRAS